MVDPLKHYSSGVPPPRVIKAPLQACSPSATTHKPDKSVHTRHPHLELLRHDPRDVGSGDTTGQHSCKLLKVYDHLKICASFLRLANRPIATFGLFGPRPRVVGLFQKIGEHMSRLVRTASSLVLFFALAACPLVLAGCNSQPETPAPTASDQQAQSQASTDQQAQQGENAEESQDNCYGDDLPVINTEALNG